MSGTRFQKASRVRAFAGVSGAFLAMAWLAVPAMAAESASPAEATAGSVFRWLNFVLVFGGIGYLISKSGGFFRANAQAIAGDIRESSTAKAAAERELQDVQAKLSGLNDEVQRLRQQAQNDAVAESERLRASQRTEIEKINLAEQAEMSAAQRVAEQELRALAASIAVDRAAALVEREMTPDARARMLRTFLTEIGRQSGQRSMN